MIQPKFVSLAFGLEMLNGWSGWAHWTESNRRRRAVGMIWTRLLEGRPVPQQMELMEDKYGQAQRVWVMDRGIASEENLAWLV